MDHLKEMFKFQLQSLEMVGCEMLFIVASSDGEFQVYGSSKGKFKFQLQSLEMVGCEMLFIVASSDGEFQVYGSSKVNV